MRRALLIAGLLSVAAAWLGPPALVAQRAFTAHMMMHVGIVAVAAPLIALGAAGGARDPVRYAPKLFSPIHASLIELVVVWAWHAPALHHAARHSSAIFIVEQGTFLLSGLFLWFSVFGGDISRRHAMRGAGLAGLLLTSMHMTLLGALLALTPRPLYHNVAGLAGITTIQDQHLGGAMMLLIGGISYLAGGIWLTAGMLRKEA